MQTYHVEPKIELEDFHLLDAEEQIPQGPYCRKKKMLRN